MNIEILNTALNFSGLIIGIFVFVVIVFARWLCIWGEYHFTKRFWVVFLIVGTGGLIFSILTEDLLISASFSALGFIFLWGIHETVEQENRVKKGWFKKKEKN